MFFLKKKSILKHFKIPVSSCRSCSKSFEYKPTATIDNDFALDARPFGPQRDKYRAVIVSESLQAQQLTLLQAKTPGGNKKDKSSSSSSSSNSKKLFVVCVKVVRKSALTSSAERDLLQELANASKLRHKNINAVYGYNNVDGQTLYIVEDFYGVGDFASLKRLRLRWSERLIAALVKAILSAFEFLHGAGVAYECLCLQNVALNSNGKIKLIASAMLASLASLAPTPSLPGTLGGGDTMRFALAREAYQSKRKRDIVDLALTLFDLIGLDDLAYEPLLKQKFDASLLMLDFVKRLVGAEQTFLESATLVKSILFRCFMLYICER